MILNHKYNYLNSVIKIDLPDTTSEEQANSEFRAIDVATDYPALKEAFQTADAIIHLAAIPAPSGPENDFRVRHARGEA